MKILLLLISLCGLMAAASWRDELEEAQKLRLSGETAEADKLYQQVLEKAQSLNAAQLNALAIELAGEARYRDAEWAYRRSLEGWDRLGPKVAVSRSITVSNLGILLQAQSRYSEAEVLLQEGLRQAETASGPESLDAARAAIVLACLYHDWGHLEKAKSQALRANAILGPLAGHSQEQRAGRQILASVLLGEGRYSEGEAMLRPLLNDLPEPSAVGAYNDLAVAETQQDHLTEAEPLAVHALELARRVLPSGHPLTAVSLNNLAQIHRFQGRYLEAEANYRDAIAIWERALGPRHPDTAKGIMNLAAFYHQRGREAGAEDLYRRAADIFESTLGKDQLFTLVARNELADVLRAQRRYSESEKLSRATLGPLEASLGEQDPRLVRALTNYARLLQETRHATEAAAVRKRIAGLAQGFTSQTP
jgi:tetratricopeptide (TPR) repeat protein